MVVTVSTVDDFTRPRAESPGVADVTPALAPAAADGADVGSALDDPAPEPVAARARARARAGTRATANSALGSRPADDGTDATARIGI